MESLQYRPTRKSPYETFSIFLCKICFTFVRVRSACNTFTTGYAANSGTRPRSLLTQLDMLHVVVVSRRIAKKCSSTHMVIVISKSQDSSSTIKTFSVSSVFCFVSVSRRERNRLFQHYTCQLREDFTRKNAFQRGENGNYAL